MKLLILSILVICASAEEHTKIAGGFFANIKDFPYMVSLQTNVDGKQTHFCGGAVIDNFWVLTAAHCVANLTDGQKSELHVVAGVTNWKRANRGQQIKVAVIKWHPNYVNAVNNGDDIALLKTEVPFVYGDKVKPATLPTEQDATPTGDAWLAGWGSTSYILNPILPHYPDLLRRAKFSIYDTDSCNNYYQSNGGINVEANICTARILASACNGDSGGPLVQDMEVIGIVSWGVIFCGTAPSVYTKVSHYLPYIQETMNES